MTIKEAFQKLSQVTNAGIKNPWFVIRNLGQTFADIADKISGGGGGSTVEVTQVLTSGTKIATIKVDGDDTDLYAPAGSASHTYSTTEQVVGKWIDNSDLYEKSYQVNLTNHSDNIIDSSFTNNVLRKYEIDFNGLSNQDSKFRNGISDTLYVNESNQLIYYIDTSSWWDGANSAFITVKYTKSAS